MGFSKGQHFKLYRPLVQRAWLAECEKSATDPKNKTAYEAWYRAELMGSELHVKSTTQCNNTSDFDALMLHFAIIVNDDALMGRYSSGSERRLKHVITEAMADLSWLLKEPFTWDYARAIYKQSKMLPKKMADAPAWQLYKCNQMLDEYIQRTCRQYGIRRRDVPALRKAGRSVETQITTITLPGSIQQLLPF